MSDQTGNEHKQGDLAQEILNRIVSDADFRQQLLDNPAETLAQAGYTGGDDVSGYFMSTLALESHTQKVEGVEPITTGINCVPPPPTTTAVNCGGGGGGGGGSTGTTQKKKPANLSPRE